jgi:hypothetical protein
MAIQSIKLRPQKSIVLLSPWLAKSIIALIKPLRALDSMLTCILGIRCLARKYGDVGREAASVNCVATLFDIARGPL